MKIITLKARKKLRSVVILLIDQKLMTDGSPFTSSISVLFRGKQARLDSTAIKISRIRLIIFKSYY